MCQSVLSTLTGFCFNILEQRGGGAGVSVGAVDSDRLCGLGEHLPHHWWQWASATASVWDAERPEPAAACGRVSAAHCQQKGRGAFTPNFLKIKVAASGYVSVMIFESVLTEGWTLLLIAFIYHYSPLLSRLTALLSHGILNEWLCVLNIHQSGVRTYSAVWLLHETAAVLAHVLCAPHNHAPVYSGISFRAIF